MSDNVIEWLANGDDGRAAWLLPARCWHRLFARHNRHHSRCVLRRGLVGEGGFQTHAQGTRGEQR